jgi:hypothetical protein
MLVGANTPEGSVTVLAHSKVGGERERIIWWRLDERDLPIVIGIASQIAFSMTVLHSNVSCIWQLI